ncbi:MAG TPA: acyl-CoA synthetase [Acidimicrobiales bacterium]|jgi:fatty-acyl-CoA synthase|nr:acyl-CoA synthetase [Acidimicrobiales bacterium]|tara:strand:- start:1012 stop:2595 length:1584 start_codon:yes stop_codon:yes gene_type:complete
MSYPGTYAIEKADHPAVIMAGTGESLSYRELDDRSAQFAQLMWDAGLRVGDHVAIFADNHIRYFEAYWAAMRSGLLFTTVNRFLTAKEASYIVQDCEAKVLVVSQAVRDVAIAMLPEIGACPIRLIFDGTAEGYENFESAIGRYPAEPLQEQPRGSIMLYSSGTTGQPKGIKRALDGSQITDPDPLGSGLVGLLFGMTADSVYLSPAPLYHSAPLSFSTGTQSVGGTVVVLEKFDPVEALQAIERYGVTHSQWVPTMFTRMLKLPEVDRTSHDLSTHQVAIHAAAPCPIEVKHQMLGWWGPILHEYYAGTEVNGFCYVGPEDWIAHPGTVGRPLIGVIHICDEDGAELEVGEPGLIYFEREEQAFEYHNAPEKTRSSQHPDHPLWTTLGDVGRVDEEGFLYLTDRKAFMIISGGVNIYPQEIEDCLILHPEVTDVAVFGVPNADFGEEVKAVVQPANGIEPNEDLEKRLLDYARERIAKYKVPRSVDFRDELPRLPTGKLYKRLLRDEYWADSSETQISPIQRITES